MAQTIYVVGEDRSGSTLLGRVLGAHSAVCDVGELYRLNTLSSGPLGCACGRTPDDCPFWGEVINALESEGVPVATLDLSGDEELYFRPRSLAPSPIVQLLGISLTGTRLAPALPRAHKMLDAAAHCSRVTDVAARVSGAGVIFDSSKVPAYGLARYMVRPESTTIVHLVRDGRATCASLMRHLQLPMTDVARRFRRRSLAALSVYWRVPRAHRMRVRYESLCASPEAEVERVLVSAGLRFEAGMLDQLTAGHALGGSRSAMLGKSKIRLDERWRTELEPNDLKTFEREAGWINRLLGYRDR